MRRVDYGFEKHVETIVKTFGMDGRGDFVGATGFIGFRVRVWFLLIHMLTAF